MNRRRVTGNGRALACVLALTLCLGTVACGGASAPAGIGPSPVLAAPAGAEGAADSPQTGGDLRFSRISIEDGLSQSVVLCMLQDQHGFMWLGTQDGLNRIRSAAEILDEILSCVRGFVGDASQSDDIALTVISRDANAD